METSRQMLRSGARLREEKRRHGSGEFSHEKRAVGFLPVFFDPETGRVEPSRFADGTPAPVHLLDGLPKEWVLERDQAGMALTCRSPVIAGFLRDGVFYTRDQAANVLHNSGKVDRSCFSSAPSRFQLCNMGEEPNRA